MIVLHNMLLSHNECLYALIILGFNGNPSRSNQLHCAALSARTEYDMANGTERFQSSMSTATAEQVAEQIIRQFQQTVEHYCSWLQNNMSASPWGMGYATLAIAARIASTSVAENVTAGFTFVQKLSQAASLQDVARIQAEFTQMQINMFDERAKELSDGVAVASNLVGALFSLLRWREVLHDMARNSPTYIEAGGEGTKRNWSAVPLAERRDR